MRGEVISSAEAMTTIDEPNWKTRPEFMLRSMAQTRASAKALRNVFAWIVVMAGLKPTPAEEMDGIQTEKPTEKAMPKVILSKSLKSQIVIVLKKLGYNPQTKADYYELVGELTSLELEEANYGEIVARLDVLLKERNGKL